MKKIVMALISAAALLGGSTVYAKSAHPKTAKSAKKVSESARRTVATDLHWRGSSIPPAFSPGGHWTR
jgi:hypothetical protein